MKNNEIEILFGTTAPFIKPHQPYSEDTISFLDALSKEIFRDAECKGYPDIITFGFWIRKSNITNFQHKFGSLETRMGKGLIFHIAPSNVAINFAYTFIFGLLAGNSNIVRVSTKKFDQTKILCRILKGIVQQQQYRWVAEQNGIVSYDHENVEWNQYFSEKCHMRMIWGGNQAISEIRKFQLSPRSGEITFADRYSFAILSASAIVEASVEELHTLAEGFYNDTFLIDQNACSSPHLICWLGEKETVATASAKFWEAVYTVSLKYDLADIKASEKYTMLCEYAAQLEQMQVRRYDNYLYVIRLTELPEDITDLRGKYGLFFEYSLTEFEDVVCKVAEKVQTCTVLGIDAKELVEYMICNHTLGIDRIVPIGHNLDMDVIWDGHDVVRELSRCILHI